MDDMTRNLDLRRISLGGPVFDVDKLRWLNGRYIRENYTRRRPSAALERWALNPEAVSRIVPLVQPRLETLGDWGRLTGPFFSDRVTYGSGRAAHQGEGAGRDWRAILQMAAWRLDGIREFTAPVLEACFRELARPSSSRSGT